MSVPSTPPRETAVEAEPARKLPFSPPVITPKSVPQTVSEPVVEPEPKKTGFSLFGRKKAEPKAPPKAEEVYAALLEWRQEQARVLHTKYRFILEDYTLKALSEKMPKTYDELLTIPGIKEKKQAQFGKSILQVLDKFRN
jgi:superfamily II DNA helicase RecQ